MAGGQSPSGPRINETWLILGWWLAWWLYMTGHLLAFHPAGEPITVGDAAAQASVGAITWAFITLVVMWLARHLPFDRRPRVIPIVTYIVVGALLSAMETVVSFTVLPRLGVPVGDFVSHFANWFPGNLVIYWLLVGVAVGFNYYRRYRQREAHAERLKTQLAQAELHLLKSQLHPHFLFNTLNAVSALMHRDVRAADRILARLSELLRVALDYSGTEQVTLREELAFLEPYLEIERARHGDRLTVEFDIEPGVMDASVPHMILQPLVENAIRHGVGPRAGPGRISVSARSRREMLDLEVEDDGPGLAPGTTLNGGLGLAITRARLEQLYGERFEFEPRNAQNGGFRVSLAIPYRRTPASEQHKENPE